MVGFFPLNHSRARISDFHSVKNERCSSIDMHVAKKRSAGVPPALLA